MARLSDPKLSARAAGLRYVSDEQVDGITRHGAPGHFSYKTAAGKTLRDRTVLKRIRALAIPPAWKNVWIAPFDNAHLMATGRDARGRKQYRYHPDFAQERDADKYAHLAAFAQILPRLRRRLRRDLAGPGLTREKVLASIVTLLEETLIRVGNEDYARSNNSFGLTTLRNRHVTVKGEQLRFLFKGKSARQWNLSLRHRRVARVIRSCQELPGQHLFEYRDGQGGIHAVSSSDVNEYLRQISDADISAKDFRTWAGTVKAAMAFHRFDGKPSARAIREVVAEVAKDLGNTVAVCRKCYIHPQVIAAFEAGKALRVPKAGRGGLSAAEQAVLTLLRRQRRAA